MPQLTFASRTDLGRVRKKNQDSLAVVLPEDLSGRADGLFIVADGMGGHAGGEIASRVTVETVPAVVSEELERANGHATSDVLAEALRAGVNAANEAVWKQGRANPELRGMGTTCVAVLTREGTAAVCNVGDSRAYLLRSERFRQITADHSLVQEHVRAGTMTADEARGSRYRNVITRGIGLASGVEPDIEMLELEEGDTLLLCSDGLSGMVQDADIARILRSTEDAQEACDRLVDTANRNGGEDNISAVIIRNGRFIQSVANIDPVVENEHNPPIGSVPARRAATPLTFGLSVLVIVLAGLLYSVGKETYQFSGAFPFVQHKPAPKPPPVKLPPPAPNLADMVYSSPVTFSKKPVRSAPLACDAQGNVYALSKQSGKILRFGIDGKTGSDFPAKLPPESSDASTHWATDAQGNLYVSFRSDHVVRKYAPAGTRIAEIGKENLVAPGAIAVDGKGSIYVVDESLIKIFKAATPTVSGSPATNETPPASHPNTDVRNSGLSVEERHGSR